MLHGKHRYEHLDNVGSTLEEWIEIMLKRQDDRCWKQVTKKHRQ
jgi:hypothetical protein